MDIWDLHFESLPVERDAECPACGRRLFPFLAAAGEAVVTSLCGQDAVQMVPRDTAHPRSGRARSPLGGRGADPSQRVPRRTRRRGAHLTVFADGRAIIKGVQRPRSRPHVGLLRALRRAAI